MSAAISKIWPVRASTCCQSKRTVLTDVEAQKLRNAARAAVTRSMELPKLAEQDRAAWLRRTMQFADAVSRLLIQHLKIRLE